MYNRAEVVSYNVRHVGGWSLWGSLDARKSNTKLQKPDTTMEFVEWHVSEVFRGEYRELH